MTTSDSTPQNTGRPELYLLGGIGLRRRLGPQKWEPWPAADRLLAQSKVIGLLAYLTLAPKGRFQRRDRLVGLLWPELDQARARAALRKSLHLARAVLGADAIATRGDEELAAPPETLWCDAAAFEAACDNGHLARALELYDGDLMPGFFLAGSAEFEHWLDDERQALRERAAAAAWAMARQLEDDTKMTLAGRWARRAVQYAGTDERVLRRTMEMLERLGDRAGALRLHDDFVKRLRSDLGTDPSGETAALAARLRGPQF